MGNPYLLDNVLLPYWNREVGDKETEHNDDESELNGAFAFVYYPFLVNFLRVLLLPNFGNAFFIYQRLVAI
jgi:hypothetical protein